eukprot:m.331605 g.331605  ORF g.331605 m.331605 type:complete len:289 (+) comp16762_c0_seq1:228-1094(+)
MMLTDTLKNNNNMTSYNMFVDDLVQVVPDEDALMSPQSEQDDCWNDIHYNTMKCKEDEFSSTSPEVMMEQCSKKVPDDLLIALEVPDLCDDVLSLLSWSQDTFDDKENCIDLEASLNIPTVPVQIAPVVPTAASKPTEVPSVPSPPPRQTPPRTRRNLLPFNTSAPIHNHGTRMAKRSPETPTKTYKASTPPPSNTTKCPKISLKSTAGKKKTEKKRSKHSPNLERLERNRIAAKESRKRRAEAVRQLEDKVQTLEKKCARDEDRIKQLLEQREKLQAILKAKQKASA